jgi:hypothetical protein
MALYTDRNFMLDLTSATHCPVTGGEIIANPDWQYRSDDYSVSYGLLDSNFILIRPNGHCKIDDIYASSKIHADIYNLFGEEFIILKDLSGLTSITEQARKLLVSRVKDDNNIHSIILYNISQKIKTAINTAIRTTRKKVNVETAHDYSSAITRAYEILGK